MSSGINLKFDREIPITDWEHFCEQHSIVYSPNTCGQNVFYVNGHRWVQISLREQGSVSRTNHTILWETARPPMTFTGMYVSSFHGSNLEMIGNVVRNIADTFPCQVSADPELAHTIVMYDHIFDITDHVSDNEYLSTDFIENWTQDQTGYHVNTEYGHATVVLDGTKYRFLLDGVLRGTFRDINTAIAFAGRCTWNWWNGTRDQWVPLVSLNNFRTQS